MGALPNGVGGRLPEVRRPRLGCTPTTRRPQSAPIVSRSDRGQHRRSDPEPFAAGPCRTRIRGDSPMGSVVKKRRKRMAKKKHRKLLRKTRVQRRRLGK